MELLDVKNIKKSFDKKEIVKDVTFSIGRGKIVGLLGRNGNGKTTIIKLINDLLTLDSGEILVDGEKIGEKTKAKISYLPERTYLDNSKTVEEVFKFFTDFYPDFDEEKATTLLKEFNLEKNQKLSKMSKGMKEKVQLALVMGRNADLYVLDEPLGGIDPATRDSVLDTILRNFGENSSLLITTHIISDIERILDEVIIIDDGKIILKGNADEIRNEKNLSIDETFRGLFR